MKFKEITKPEFTLELSLEEAVELWHIVNKENNAGNKKAKPFVDALTDFASRSNAYTYLK